MGPACNSLLGEGSFYFIFYVIQGPQGGIYSIVRPFLLSSEEPCRVNEADR